MPHTFAASLTLSIAREIKERIAPAEIILAGSKAVGVRCCDSNVYLTAVCPNAASGVQADKVLREMLVGKYDDPVVNVHAITLSTQAEFPRLAPPAQSFTGQAARHGVTPTARAWSTGRTGDRRRRRFRQGSLFWLRLAQEELEFFLLLSGNDWPGGGRLLPLHSQWALQWAVKVLLYAGNDPVRFRRDAAVKSRHIQSVRPLTEPERAEAVEQLLSATAEADGERCCLTAFIEAYRRTSVCLYSKKRSGLNFAAIWIRRSTP